MTRNQDPEERMETSDEFYESADEKECRSKEQLYVERLSINPEHLRKSLKNSVIGQDEAIDSFVEGLVRQTVDLIPERPGSFLFLGPTGVGKNYLVETAAREVRKQGLKAATRTIFGPSYSSGYEVSKLLGSPPGYVGGDVKPILKTLYEECGQNSFYFAIFDEFEKGHDKLKNIILGLTDTGLAETANNEEINIINSTIIMTSNAGYSDVEARRKPIGYGVKNNGSLANNLVKTHFSPELLGRVEEVYFRSLNEEEIHKVAELEIDRLIGKTKLLGISVGVDPEVVPYLVNKANWETYGCRNIRNTTAKYLGKELNSKALSVLQQTHRFDSLPPKRQLELIIQEVSCENIGLQLKVGNDRIVSELYKSASN